MVGRHHEDYEQREEDLKNKSIVILSTLIAGGTCANTPREVLIYILEKVCQ